MYDFTIQDMEGNEQQYYSITKVIYSTAEERFVLENDEIFTHEYRTDCDLHLFSETEAYTISKKIIGVIQVSKDD